METYISWHLFGNNWDEWYNTRKEAETAYKASEYSDLRLYKTTSSDDDTTDTEELYIKGRGKYPN